MLPKGLSDPGITMAENTTTATAEITAITEIIETVTAITTADPADPRAAAATRGGAVTAGEDLTSTGGQKRRTAWEAAAAEEEGHTSTPGDSPVRIATSKLIKVEKNHT